MLQSPQRHPNGRRYQGIGKDDAKGETKEGAIIDRGPRMAEVKCIEVRKGTVLRHEGLFDHNVLAAGAAQAHDVPVVVDAVVTTRHEKTAHIGWRVLLRGRDSTAEDSPLAKIAAARERP